MRLLNPLLVSAIVAITPATASAADMISYSISTQSTLPVANDNIGDWNGFYAGIYGVAQQSPLGGSQYGVGIALGAMLSYDFYLLGAEVDFQGLNGGAGATSYGQVLARGGVLVTDSLLAYASAGYGLDLGAPEESDVLVGGGLELKVNQDLSLRTQYLRAIPSTGNNPKDQVTFGANFHF